MEDILESQHKLLTWVKNSVSNLKKEGLAKVTTGAVQSRITGIEQYKDRFDKQHAYLLSTYKEEFKETKYWKSEIPDQMEEAVITQRGMLLDYLSTLMDKKKESPQERKDGGHVGNKKFPDISLPRFSGSYEDWSAFKDLFQSMVGKNQAFSDVDKLHYLKVSLEGEAEEVIKFIPTVGENYNRAWELLTKQFEKKRLIVKSCLTKFRSLTKMKAETQSELKRILQGVNAVVNNLESIDRPIPRSEDLLVHLILELLDPGLLRDFENSISHDVNPPSYACLKEFLEQRSISLLALQSAQPTAPPAGTTREVSSPGNTKTKTKAARSHQTQQTKKTVNCPLCKGEHYLMICPDYKSKDALARKGIIHAHQLCMNCLGSHTVQNCLSKRTCLVCNGKHHSSIHEAFSCSQAPKSAGSHTARGASEVRTVLLATARIRVLDRLGRCHEARALIDQGSEISIVTERLAQRLQLPRSPTSVTIYGVGGMKVGQAKGQVHLTFGPMLEMATMETKAVVMTNLTHSAESTKVDMQEWDHIKGLTLADPDFEKGDRVDVLLGADVHASIIRAGLRKGTPDQPIAQHTALGWIVSGPVNTKIRKRLETLSFQCSAECSLSNQIRQFWEQEELPALPKPRTAMEENCEQFYVRTHVRTQEGRYVVRLPFVSNVPDLSHTERAAMRALNHLERRFTTNSDLKALYMDFMHAYEALGHMSQVSQDALHGSGAYLPHHGVLKAASTTTKLRVVFNGSSKTQNCLSLNDFFHVGENLLPSLPDLITRWRMHNVVLVADMEKMYRQILVHPEDRMWQQIFWRTSADEEVRKYTLNTVTYGLSCAPFLAVRTVKQLAVDESSRFPLGAAALATDTYVDDILTGAEDLETAKTLKGQLTNICMAGGFFLRKWASNHSSLMGDSPVNSSTSEVKFAPESAHQAHPTLGLLWDPVSDCFLFSVKKDDSELSVTKRLVFSQTAQLFDPLGWLAPVVAAAKIFMQRTWLLKIDWDTPLPPSDTNHWQQFRSTWSLLTQLRIPRKIAVGRQAGGLQLLGFADASQKAYAAVLYLKQKTSNGEHMISLVSAKSKVAPIKQISLPRLELCAAHLLSKLAAHTLSVLKLNKAELHLWSDSTITLEWIRSHPSRWQTFVANRVSEIQSLTPDAIWHHVPSDQNPADCASRGILPEELLQHALWWNGPDLLRTEVFPAYTRAWTDEMPEERSKVSNTLIVQERDSPILERFSTLHKLLRVTAWCLRWKSITRVQRFKTPECSPSSSGKCKAAMPLSTSEIQQAEDVWTHHAQLLFYNKEIEHLKASSSIERKSSLLALNPFLDKTGMLRVGGRLKHSLLLFDQKHPKILPPQSKFTQLVIESFHRQTFHGGVQLTLASLRQQFWIPKGRQVVKKVIHRCVTCVRWRAAPPKQLMGNLPRARVTQSRPFQYTGVDYAGPVQIRMAPGRGMKSMKGFFVIFVCLSTRAVHLDLASNYSAQAFLAAFRRFVARRGLCSELFSDCGTNFVGADNELRSLFKTASESGQFIANQLTMLKVRWNFMPPAAPHFGGMWEAAVKSTKFHLRRVLGEATLTYEEMATLLSQVEACLNSRPICPLSDDPDDLNVLTPGHFLVGSAVTSIPEPGLLNQQIPIMQRWRLVNQMRDQFWARWAQEYLQGLMKRSKWTTAQPNVQRGQLCIIRDEATPPGQWPLARIVAAHPGPDGHVRVVTVKTVKSEFVRPISKIVVLPIRTDESGSTTEH